MRGRRPLVLPASAGAALLGAAHGPATASGRAEFTGPVTEAEMRRALIEWGIAIEASDRGKDDPIRQAALARTGARAAAVANALARQEGFFK